MVLKVFYLPRSPGRFRHAFNIRVGHFEPDTIWMYGESIYPKLTLALPRDHSDQHSGEFTELLHQAIDNVTRCVNNLDPTMSKPKELLPFHYAAFDTGHLPLSLANKVSIEDYFKTGYSSVCMTLMLFLPYKCFTVTFHTQV